MSKEIEMEISTDTISKTECGFCHEIVNSLDLELTQVPLSYFKLWACDDCRRGAKIESKNGYQFKADGKTLDI